MATVKLRKAINKLMHERDRLDTAVRLVLTEADAAASRREGNVVIALQHLRAFAATIRLRTNDDILLEGASELERLADTFGEIVNG